MSAQNMVNNITKDSRSIQLWNVEAKFSVVQRIICLCVWEIVLGMEPVYVSEFEDDVCFVGATKIKNF